LIVALMASCSREDPLALAQTVDFKLNFLYVGVDLRIRLPATARLDGVNISHRTWTTNGFSVYVSSDQEKIKASFEDPCAGRVVPERGRAVVASKKETTHGSLWLCEIHDEMDKRQGVWVVRLVRNVTELIECYVPLGTAPTETTRDAAVAICESLQVRGRSEFVREDWMGSDTVRPDPR